MSEVAPKSGEYEEGKLWFKRKGSMVTLGLTHSALEELGAVEEVELPDEGEDFDKGEVVVTVEGTRGSIEVIAPAAGVISEINAGAREESDVIAEDPLEEGWLVKIEIQDKSDLKEFIDDSG